MLREIKCDLTDAELLRKGQEMALLQRDKELVEMQKKESAAEFKGKIDGLENKLSKVCAIIRDKYEMRQVNCREVKDFVNKVRRIIRCDNEEEIEVHPMTPADLQGKLPNVPTEPVSENKKPLPVTFEDADVGMVWLSSVLGEVEVVARADDSVVVRQVAGPDTSRITKEMWAAHKMTFLRFVPPPSVAGALPQTATQPAPEKVEPGQIWQVYGFKVEVLKVLDDGDIEVKYPDGMHSFMPTNEWRDANPEFVAIRVKSKIVEQTEEAPPGKSKSKGGRGRKRGGK